MIEQTIKNDITAQLEKEGEGRYTAYLARPGKGRVRIGTVMGGRGVWAAEAIPSTLTYRDTQRNRVTRRLAEWALTQPGGKVLAS